MGIKAVAILAFVLALVIGVWWYGAHDYHLGYKAGAAQIQTQWDADKEAIQRLTDAAIARANKDRDDALANNEGISNDLQAQLSAARTLNDDLAQRLRDYQSRPATGGGAVPKAGNHSGVVTVTVGPGVPDLDAAIGAALNECRANYYDQVALIKELTPQL